ncbi:hypothetical protein EV121DRAFT_181968, partial [Schizophyllum commune]
GQSEDAEEKSAGAEELKDFAISNLYKIIELERKTMEVEASDLELLCRMDISLLRSDSGLKYYVKNVERGLTTCMLGWMDWSTASGDINRFASLLSAFVG